MQWYCYEVVVIFFIIETGVWSLCKHGFLSNFALHFISLIGTNHTNTFQALWDFIQELAYKLDIWVFHRNQIKYICILTKGYLSVTSLRRIGYQRDAIVRFPLSAPLLIAHVLHNAHGLRDQQEYLHCRCFQLHQPLLKNTHAA